LITPVIASHPLPRRGLRLMPPAGNPNGPA